MNFENNVANRELNDLFDCRGNEIAPAADNGASGDCPLAMVYAVSQQFRNVYDPATGLAKGTVFAELDLPFTASEGGRKC
jgi:hypothetical protein